MNNKGILIGIIAATVLILVGSAVLLGQSSSGNAKAVLGKIAGAKVESLETSFDFKDIPYSGGNVQHEYKIKNVGEKSLEIANLATSCMCTKVFFQKGAEKSPEFGMKGHTASSNWKGSLAPGEEGLVIAVFDPTAHGPQGVGPISRLVSLGTNDPDRPYLEFSFNGKVVK